jgi:hypothetical protein
MTVSRINRTYTASERSPAAYPYRGAPAVRGEDRSGIDHGDWTPAFMIGAGSPTGPEGFEQSAKEETPTSIDRSPYRTDAQDIWDVRQHTRRSSHYGNREKDADRERARRG